MTLPEVTDVLLKTLFALEEKLPLLEQEEFRYTNRLMQLIADAPQTSQDKREAVAKSILIEEGIYESYHSLKLDIRLLLLKKEIYTEISRNLRTPSELLKITTE